MRLLRDRSDGAPRVPRSRNWHRALRLLLGDGGEAGLIKDSTSLGHHAARTESAGSAVAAPPANATTRFVNWRAAAASRR